MNQALAAEYRDSQRQLFRTLEKLCRIAGCKSNQPDENGEWGHLEDQIAMLQKEKERNLQLAKALQETREGLYNLQQALKYSRMTEPAVIRAMNELEYTVAKGLTV